MLGREKLHRALNSEGHSNRTRIETEQVRREK